MKDAAGNFEAGIRDNTIVEKEPTATSRDEKLDFLRGICVVGMICWHLLSHPSYPKWLSFPIIQANNFGAEGFILLAGTVIGMKMSRASARAKDLWPYLRRALTLLLLHYAMISCFFVIVALTHPATPTLPNRTITQWLWGILTLRYQGYLFDILPIYVFLFASLPLFWLIYRWFGNKGLLAISALIYLIYFNDPTLCLINGGGSFHWNGWQVFFVLGLIVGTRYKELMRFCEAHSMPLLLFVSFLFFLAAFCRFCVKADPELAAWLPWQLRDTRRPLSLLRLAYALLEVAVIGLVLVRYWARISGTVLAHCLNRFGQKSLRVFVASVALDYLLKADLTHWQWGFPENLLIWAFDLGLLYCVATFRVPARVLENRKHLESVPVAQPVVSN